MLEIKDVSKSYKKREVLRIDNLTFERNKLYGVVGHNGAGKTTLFKCITNIVCSYKGEIKLGGINIKENPSVLTSVGLVLDGMSVFNNQTGMFNIKYFSGLRNNYNDELVNQLIDELGLNKFINEKVKNYSYGTKKKLILLIALINNPKLLILDEPFRGLDIETVEFFQNYLKKLQNNGLTLIISSHVLSDLENLCDEVVVIKNGQLERNIDVNNLKAAQYRTINTTNNERLKEIFQEYNIKYELSDDLIKFSINDDNWSIVYQILMNEQIIINEMNKISVLKDELSRRTQ